MRLLVVTPTLGLSPYLGAAVESVSRTQLDIEHVLIAPGHAVGRLMRDHAHCTVVAEGAPAGMYAAIREGVRAAAPWDWFTYLNDDDLLDAGFAEVANRHMQLGDPLAIAYGDVKWIDENGASLGRMPLEKNRHHVGYAMKLGLAPLTQQGALVSRSLYDSLGGFDTRFRLAADFDFWARAFVAGASFRYYPLPVARWRIHGLQASADRSAAYRDAAMIAAALPVRASRWRRKWEYLRFRLLNAGRYLERRRITGKWSSDALFAAARQD
ncbi:N/A [soil metagenome]